jgi:hypothetical protein
VKSMGVGPDSDNEYSPEYERGGHIVSQSFIFDHRSKEMAKIVKLLEDRCKRHKAMTVKGPIRDKTHNPLIALPGSPGSGKSAMLANIPASKQWVDFCAKGPRAIISTLTWNSSMTDGPQSLGLRIIFGAMRSHGFTEEQWLPWAEKMLNEESEAHKLTACQAVTLLRNLLGNDRPVLLLIDELAKVDQPPYPIGGARSAKYMGEIGSFLDASVFDASGTKYASNMAVVSSLAGEFIKTLLSGSQRQIKYVAVPPLLDAGLGENEVGVWAERVLSSVQPQPVGEYVTRMLKSSHLLMSGHPRSLQRLVEDITDTTSVSSTLISALTEKTHFLHILQRLAERSADLSSYFDDTLSIFEHGVLSTALVTIGDTDEISQTLRLAVDAGKIFLVPNLSASASPYYRVGVPGFAVLLALKKLARLENPEGPLCKAAKDIFGNPFNNHKAVSDLFERSVDMTLISRSHSAGDVMEMFGITGQKPRNITVGKLEVVQQPGEAYTDMLNCRTNELYIPPEHQRGFDSRVTLVEPGGVDNHVRNTFVFYIQDKIALSNAPPEKVYAKMYTNVLAEHKKLLPNLEPDDIVAALANVHIVMYNWGDRGDNAPTPEAVKNRLKEILNKGTAKTLDEFKFADQVFDDHFSKNVHTVARPGLDEWLIPSLRIIPRLVQEIERTKLD